KRPRQKNAPESRRLSLQKSRRQKSRRLRMGQRLAPEARRKRPSSRRGENPGPNSNSVPRNQKIPVRGAFRKRPKLPQQPKLIDTVPRLRNLPVGNPRQNNTADPD